MMEFEEFAMKVKVEVGKMAREEAKLHVFKKNNGGQAVGLSILGAGCISPVIYLDEFYRKYEKNESFESIVQEIWELFLDRKEKSAIDVSNIALWEKARENLTVKLINYEANREMLAAMPHRRFLDLAAVYVLMENGMSQQEVVTVDSRLAEKWGVGIEELDAYANSNYEKYFPEKISSLEEILMGDCGEASAEIELLAVPKIYVLTNQKRIYGASAMLFQKNLNELAERCQGDLYILPSSIHEVLAFKATEEEPDELREMVKEINRTEVLLEERLSDNVYRYCYESGQINIV